MYVNLIKFELLDSIDKAFFRLCVWFFMVFHVSAGLALARTNSQPGFLSMCFLNLECTWWIVILIIFAAHRTLIRAETRAPLFPNDDSTCGCQKRGPQNLKHVTRIIILLQHLSKRSWVKSPSKRLSYPQKPCFW